MVSERAAGARGSGLSHPGHMRPKNEDRYLVDDDLGLYAVFDGMGGHAGGDVAAALARDVILHYIAEKRHRRPPRQLLERAFQRASSAVYREAQRREAPSAMGTTAVAVLVGPHRRATVASVGDSRAYLARGGGLRLLTRDQTIVNELIASGSLSREAAESHPYRSVLSNNLGARPRTHVQLADLTLKEGDRLLLCSDGLTGFASAESVASIALGVLEADRAAEDLIERALEGGGGDNVTAVVIDAEPRAAGRTSIEVRQAGADAWSRRRARFIDAARARGLAKTPIGEALPDDEVVALIGGNFAEACARDLETSRTEHVEVFAEKLAAGWLEQGGEPRAPMELFDVLLSAAADVVSDMREAGDPLADAVEAEIYRGLAAAEGVLGRLLSARLRAAEGALASARRASEVEDEAPPVPERATVSRAQSRDAEPAPPELARYVEEAARAARGNLDSREERAVLARMTPIIAAGAGAAERRRAAGELAGERTLDEVTAVALFAALDRAREAHLGAIRTREGEASLRAAAMERAALGYQGMAAALAELVLAAGLDVARRRAEISADIRRLREEVRAGEARLAEVEEGLAEVSGQAVDTIVSEGEGER